VSKISLEGNVSGSGTFTIASPNSNSNFTLTLPQATTTVVGTDATQTLTNKTWASPASSTISSATAQASTSGTSIDFTGIPSWVKRITVMFNGVSGSGTSAIQVQLGDAGGFETAGYVGASGRMDGSTVTNQAQFTSGFQIAVINANTNTQNGVLVLDNISGNTWIAQGQVYSGVFVALQFTAGTKTLSDTITQIRITTVNGTDTFDAGSINILYE
jgi:hypothetical protein